MRDRQAICRNGSTALITFIQALYILVGVNFPVDALPGVLQKVAYGLPLTRGVMAARLVLDGAGWSAIRSLVVGETLIGALYSAAGYAIFRIIEKRSTISGTLDAL